MDLLHCNGPAIFGEQPQPNLPQLETMRVLSQPMERFLMSLILRRITDLATIRIEVLQPDLFRIMQGRPARTVPAPLRLGTKRNQIGFWEALQSGKIRSERKLSVSYRKGRQR